MWIVVVPQLNSVVASNVLCPIENHWCAALNIIMFMVTILILQTLLKENIKFHALWSLLKAKLPCWLQVAVKMFNLVLNTAVIINSKISLKGVTVANQIYIIPARLFGFRVQSLDEKH